MGKKKTHRIGEVLIVPYWTFFAVVVAIPLIYSFVLGFFKWNLTEGVPSSFVGISNYREILSPSSSLWGSLRVTGLYVLGAVSIEFMLGLGIALLLLRDRKVAHFVRGILLVPLATAPIVNAILWRSMYDPSVGPINYLLCLLGFPRISFLSDPLRALLSVIVVDVWITTPFVALVLLAALMSFPQDLVEASKVDGASSWQVFRYLTLPLLSRVISITLLIRSMDAFKTFEIIYSMTRGGPALATNVVSVDLYHIAFRYFKMGKAAAYSWVTISVLLIGTIFLTRYAMRKEEG